MEQNRETVYWNIIRHSQNMTNVLLAEKCATFGFVNLRFKDITKKHNHILHIAVQNGHLRIIKKMIRKYIQFSRYKRMAKIAYELRYLDVYEYLLTLDNQIREGRKALMFSEF